MADDLQVRFDLCGAPAGIKKPARPDFAGAAGAVDPHADRGPCLGGNADGLKRAGRAKYTTCRKRGNF